MAALSKPAEALALLLFFLPFISCFAASSRIEQLTSLSGGGLQDGIFLPRRSAAEVPPADVVVVDNSSFVLAAPRTHRKDPLDGFHRYTGGWNISEKHYWASVGYTAAPLFAIALAWFIGFGLVLLFICCWFFCCRRRSYSYSRAAYALSLILLVLFTCAAIIGCVVLYTGQGKFHRSTYSTMDYVVSQANFTVENLRNFSDSLSDAKKITVDQVLLPSNVRADIDDIEARVNKSANQLADRTSDNSRKIRRVLDRVRLDLIIIAAVMLLLAFIGFLLSILGLQYIVSILVVVGWILVTGTFILCGVFLILHNVVADSCVAMNEWVDHPYAHTALDDILPCVDVATANESLSRSREVTFQLVNVVNQVIANISNQNFPPQLKPLYFNQSGPLMPLLCNPYMPDLNNRPCFLGEVDFNNATQVKRPTTREQQQTGVHRAGRGATASTTSSLSIGDEISSAEAGVLPLLGELQDLQGGRGGRRSMARVTCPPVLMASRILRFGIMALAVGRAQLNQLATRVANKELITHPVQPKKASNRKDQHRTE
ncbi:hypothetical protein ZIOFF_016705 [Zingiber officinale]|uniref:Uncharacterized protein n=1 Tax=Zingiber officinale TaxID=94328 RepID=A0A8J5HT38_ZINOF|nr:hypothetical protein ZIOFF_016705 [Zingiber officinale]